MPAPTVARASRRIAVLQENLQRHLRLRRLRTAFSALHTAAHPPTPSSHSSSSDLDSDSDGPTRASLNAARKARLERARRLLCQRTGTTHAHQLEQQLTDRLIGHKGQSRGSGKGKTSAPSDANRKGTGRGSAK